MTIKNTIDAAELRSMIVARLTAGPASASQLAADLEADLGQRKSGLKVLADQGRVARRDRPNEPPLFEIAMKRRADHRRRREEPREAVVTRTKPRLGAMT